jgi:hypothetical protein
MKVGSEFLEMEWNTTELIVNVGQIQRGTNREGLAPIRSIGGLDLTAQEMASVSLLQRGQILS